MYKEILKLLKCPKCNGELNLIVEKEENNKIVEDKRVLKIGHSLLDSYIIIDEHSKGFKILKEFCMDNKIIGAEKFVIKTGLEKAYLQLNFDKVDIVTIGESVGEKNDFDLLPFYGEWFALVVVKSTK